MTIMSERNLTIHKESENGASNKDIASRHGLSTERVRQIVLGVERKLQHATQPDGPVKRWPTRLVNALRNRGLSDSDLSNPDILSRISRIDIAGTTNLGRSSLWHLDNFLEDHGKKLAP